MQITLLCNAGLALTVNGTTLLVDALNEQTDPFCTLKEETWRRIILREPPFDRVCGLYFTHNHADHYSADLVRTYCSRWPEVPVFLPNDSTRRGKLSAGPFRIEYQRFDHAPMDVPTPPHVITWIEAMNKSVYIAADAKLDADGHRAFLDGRTADVAFWNSMYLSQTQTRQLLREAAGRNFIYHMPENRSDNYGLWRKCEKNLQRFGDELKSVTVLEQYPCELKGDV